MKKIILLSLCMLLALYSFSQSMAPQSRQAVKTITNLLPKMNINEQYTQPIAVENFGVVRQDWEAFNENHNAAVTAWNKIPKYDYAHPDVQAIRKPLADRIEYFQKWTVQLKAAQKIIGDNPAAASNSYAALSETAKQKLAEISALLSNVEARKEYAGVLNAAQYVAAAEWFLKIKGNYTKAVGLLNSIAKFERPHPDAMKQEEKVLAIQPLFLNVQSQLKTIGTAQTSSGLRKAWAEDIEKYKDAVLIFADVLEIDMPQNTSNSRTLFQLKPENYDKTMKDLEALAALMTGTYKDLVDNFAHFFPTLEYSPCVYRMVSVNRIALLPAVVKLSATRFMGNAMSGAPRISDLENDEGWIDGTFSKSESKKKLAEVKSWFTPVLKKSGITETEAGLNNLDTVYNAYWRKAEELAPKWTFPSDANAAGDARAKTLFTNELKAAYPGVQIIKLGFAWDAKWTLYIDGTNQPRYRTIGTTALIKLPGEKFYTAWKLLFNENHVGGGKFSGGEIKWLEWRWQENK